jgi:hypothetical protein
MLATETPTTTAVVLMAKGYADLLEAHRFSSASTGMSP